MPLYVLDSSALVKYYHQEVGSAAVIRLINAADTRRLLSRLAVVEAQSSFARKMRMGDINDAEFTSVWQQFVRDIHQRRFEVVRVADRHYENATNLLRTYARQSLRTFDALQLAIARDVHRHTPLESFVCADARLCEIANQEQLAVFNPTAM